MLSAVGSKTELVAGCMRPPPGAGRHSQALGTLGARKDIVSPQSACILFTNALAKRSAPSWLGPQLACGGHHIDERGTHLLPTSSFQSAVGIDPELPIGNSLPRQHNQLLDFRRCGNAR